MQQPNSSEFASKTSQALRLLKMELEARMPLVGSLRVTLGMRHARHILCNFLGMVWSGNTTPLQPVHF